MILWNPIRHDYNTGNKANLMNLIAAIGLVILLKLDSNRRLISPCDIGIWWMTSKNNKASSLYYIKLFFKSNLSYSPEALNSGKNWRFFLPCDLEIWWMTLKNNRAPLLCWFKLCASFYSHWWIQTGVTVRKCPIWVKIDNFLTVWPWNKTDDLGKQQGTSSKQHQALCIISSPYVNSNGATVQQRLNGVMTSVTLTFYIWPWPFAWTSRLPVVITLENFRMIRWHEHC